MKLARPLPEPERWSERAGGLSAEDIVGASFRQIRATTEPSDAAALRWGRHAMTAAPRAARGRVWSVAIAAAILAASGAVAARVVAWRAAVTSARAHARAEAPAPAPVTHRRMAARQATTAAPDLEIAPRPVPEILPAAPPPQAPSPPPTPKTLRPQATEAVRRRTTEPPAPGAAADTPDEAGLLARAFRHLRNEGDAAAALGALDERERRFGAGTLATEAALARTEALLLLGRTHEALSILVGMRDARDGLTPDVRATRADLLAKAKRCTEAGADFDVLLAPDAPAATRERALYGRASCRLQGDRTTEAVPDLERYLRDYPQGRFAPAVRDALGELRRP